MGSTSYSFPRAKETVDIKITRTHESFQKLVDGRLLTAPISDPVGRVLDIGTGSGIWAAEFATQYPSAVVVGIDNFPQPQIPRPSNCHFMHQDAEADWNLGDDKFDVMHTRIIPFHANAMAGVIRRCYEHLKPGGIIEMQEILSGCQTDEPAGAPEHSSKVIEWAQLRSKAVAKLGIDRTIVSRLPEMLSDAGFVDLHVQDIKMPIGPWMEDEKMKDVGNTFMECLQLTKMGQSIELLTHVGMNKDEILDLVDQVGKELGVGKIYTTTRFLWARKPL